MPRITFPMIAILAHEWLVLKRPMTPKSSQWLRDAGIITVADLEQLGAVAAYRLVKDRQPKVSLNLLWAIAAGLKGKDWRELPESTKQRLRKEADEA